MTTVSAAARSADSFADLITLSTRCDNEDANTVGNQAVGDWFIKASLKLPLTSTTVT